MPMNPRLLRPTSSTLDKDAAIYLNAVAVADGQQLEPAVRKAVNDFVVGCKQDGIWSAIKASCILAGARTLAGALVPLVGSAPTNNNFVSGDYDRETGLVGNESTKHLNTNVLGNSLPTHNAHLAAYVSVKAEGANVFQYRSVMASGTSGIAGRYMMDARGYDAAPSFSIQSTATSNLASGAGSVVNFIGVRRNTSTTFGIRNTGASSMPNGNGQGGVADNILVFAASNAGTPINHSAHRVAFYSAGEDLDLALLETRVNNLITAIGAAI